MRTNWWWAGIIAATVGFACGGKAVNDGSGAAETGGAGAGGSTSPTSGLRCESPDPLSFEGSETGFVTCIGFLHRAEQHDCPSTVPRPYGIRPSSFEMPECLSDADCATMLHGHCTETSTFSEPARVQCVSGCVRDEDCAADELCLCGDPVGTCVNAQCKSDADCGGLLCAASPEYDSRDTGRVIAHFVCQ